MLAGEKINYITKSIGATTIEFLAGEQATLFSSSNRIPKSPFFAKIFWSNGLTVYGGGKNEANALFHALCSFYNHAFILKSQKALEVIEQHQLKIDLIKRLNETF